MTDDDKITEVKKNILHASICYEKLPDIRLETWKLITYRISLASVHRLVNLRQQNCHLYKDIQPFFTKGRPFTTKKGSLVLPLHLKVILLVLWKRDVLRRATPCYAVLRRVVRCLSYTIAIVLS